MVPHNGERLKVDCGSGKPLPQRGLILFLASLLAIPLARQSSFDAALLTGLQVVGVTFYFLDDVFLLNLALEPAQSVFERFAFLYANLCQRIPPPNLPWGSFMIPKIL